MTIKRPLARLEQVDLRRVWESEANDFTPWLAEENNIALLGETIGLELEVEAQEKEVGPFRADILCRDTSTDDWVLIENQLERTNHKHLGQLLTYASGLKAVTIVWIAYRFTDEHRAALDWLNDISDEKFRFFGLEVQAWRIKDSPPAPKFNVISKPNDWSRDVAGSAKKIADADLTGAKQLHLEFWKQFCQFAEKHARRIRPQKPAPRHWMAMAIGRSGFRLSASVIKRVPGGEQGEIRAALVIRHLVDESAFPLLEKEKAKIEAEFGEPLEWQATPGVKKKQILTRRAAKLDDRAAWPEYHEWLVDRLDRLHETFHARVRGLELATPEESEED